MSGTYFRLVGDVEAGSADVDAGGEPGGVVDSTKELLQTM
jgi:hypothetical protein